MGEVGNTYTCSSILQPLAMPPCTSVSCPHSLCPVLLNFYLKNHL
jgi:hypothetical protein